MSDNGNTNNPNQQFDERSARDIKNITIELLLVAREIAGDNPTKAQMLFGLNDDAVEALPELDLGAIYNLASMTGTFFTPRLPSDLVTASIQAAQMGDTEALNAISETAAIS